MGSLRSWHASGEAGLAVYTPKNGTSTKNNRKHLNVEFGRQACAVFFRSDWVGVAKACARSIFLGLSLLSFTKKVPSPVQSGHFLFFLYFAGNTSWST
jgi:hypothetical protein